MTIQQNTEEDITKCPLCGSENGLTALAKLALSKEEFHLIEENVGKGTFKDMLKIADIAFHKLDPSNTETQLQVSNAITELRESSLELTQKFTDGQKQFMEELSKTEGREKELLIKQYEEKHSSLLKEFQKDLVNNSKAVELLEKERLREFSELKQSVNDIKEKIMGTRIGEIGELITLLDLKKAVPEDSFSETRSASHGTDILATVKDKGRECGAVTVSVKYQNNWSNEFLVQLAKNVKEDGTKWGILVTKTFPREALSTKAWLTEDGQGNTIILVKPEYAPLVYIGLREAVIHSFKTKQVMEKKETLMTEEKMLVDQLATWINGQEFEETVLVIDNARKNAEKTRQSLNQLQNYLNLKLTDALKFQGHIIEHLMHAKSLVGSLRGIMGSPFADNLGAINDNKEPVETLLESHAVVPEEMVE
jgi:hypothetical protein